MIIGFGFVSLAIDMVSDGAISVSGALLEQLAATATLVGLVTGGAEALALMLRLVTGPWADRTRAYWGFAIAGYSVSAISVPLLALSPFLGGAGLVVASVLILLERTGKAVRAPAKTVLLAEPAEAVGLGKGFGVHKVLDQVGSFVGPLIVSAITAAAGALWPAFLVLIVPAGFAMALIAWLHARVPDVRVYRAAELVGTPTSADPTSPAPVVPASRATFVLFAVFAALTEFGLLSFGVISFHLAAANLASVAAVPLVYALGMAVAAPTAGFRPSRARVPSWAGPSPAPCTARRPRWSSSSASSRPWRSGFCSSCCAGARERPPEPRDQTHHGIQDRWRGHPSPEYLLTRSPST